jgi:hypothetical protein
VVVNVTWLAKRENVAILVHDVSLSAGEVLAGFHTRLDTPPILLRHHRFSRIVPDEHRLPLALGGLFLGPLGLFAH